MGEGTFLYDRNTINRDEYGAGNNLEAGLGFLVTKRLVDAHLAAKQRDAERLQRELEVGGGCRGARQAALEWVV